MKKLLFSIAFVAFTAGVFAQSFEGTMEFKKMTLTDTISYVYYIKGDRVRIDEIGNRSHKVEGTLLIDLKSNKMTSISHERKLYMEQPVGNPAKLNGNPEVKQTGNSKTVAGYKCSEHIVNNKEENTQISYWVAPGKFDFFEKLLKVLNRKDKFSTYFMRLSGVSGMFPFLAVQTNGEGKETGRLEVFKVEKKAVGEAQFDVPKDYKMFDKSAK